MCYPKRADLRLNFYLSMFQVDMDSFVWQERQFNQKVDLAEIPQKVSAYYVSRIADLEKDVQKLCNEKNILVQKFEEASREPVLFLLCNMLEIFFLLIIVRSTSALPFLSHVI